MKVCQHGMQVFLGIIAYGMTVAQVGLVAMLNQIQDERSGGYPALRIGPEIIDLKRLQMFFVAVKEGTFAAAAQSLGLSPSAVSHALKALEEDVGCALFKRNGPHVEPTVAAIRLLPIVEELLLRVSSIRSELAKMNGRDEKLTFGISSSARVLLASSVMSAFCECFPNADVEIVRTLASGEREKRDDLDFEIGCLENAPRDAVRRMIAEEKFNVYAAPFHDLGLSGKITTAQMRRHVLVFPDRTSADLVTAELFQKSEMGLRKWIMPDASAARDLAIQGQCLAFLPESAAEASVLAGDLNLLKTSTGPLKRSYCAWWQAGSPLPWIAEVFLSLLAVHFGNDD